MVIVTHNSSGVIEACLDSLAKMAGGLEPIVVDNASSDDTLKRVRAREGVRVIANEKNLGFAAAVNQGFRATDSEFVLLLNPDVELRTAVDALVAGSRKFGISAGKLVDVDGQDQAGFTIRRFPGPAALILELFGVNRIWRSNPVNRRYRYFDRSLAEAGDVEQPAGAFLMVRRDVWQKLRGFDERFFPIWFEDVDFCRRAVNQGFRITFVPQVEATHAGAHSIRKISRSTRARHWCDSLLRYAAKHFSPLGYRATCAAVVVSSVPRMVAGMILQRNFSPVTAYSKIICFAGLCLVSSRRRGVDVPTNT